MYDIKWIREHPDAFDRGLKRRGLDPLSKKLVALDEKRRAAITKFEQAQARRNAASKEIGDAKKAKDEAKAGKLMAEVAELKTSLPAMEDEQKALAAALDKELAQIPNTPLDDVPDGADASGNVEHHVFGKKRDYAFKTKQHFDLGEALGQLNFEWPRNVGRVLLFAEGFGTARARARPVHARCAHRQGAWIHRGESADPCSRRRHVWDGAATEVRR
jgi:seryl-tRNA synthetase